MLLLLDIEELIDVTVDVIDFATVEQAMITLEAAKSTRKHLSAELRVSAKNRGKHLKKQVKQPCNACG